MPVLPTPKAPGPPTGSALANSARIRNAAVTRGHNAAHARPGEATPPRLFTTAPPRPLILRKVAPHSGCESELRAREPRLAAVLVPRHRRRRYRPHPVDGPAESCAAVGKGSSMSCSLRLPGYRCAQQGLGSRTCSPNRPRRRGQAGGIDADVHLDNTGDRPWPGRTGYLRRSNSRFLIVFVATSSTILLDRAWPGARVSGQSAAESTRTCIQTTPHQY